MNNTDYYSILGIPKNATSEQIKKAFQKIAKEYHPDKNPGCQDSENKMKAASEAYSVLSDPDRRNKYDNSKSFQFSPGTRWSRTSGPGFSDFMNHFQDMFNNGFDGFDGFDDSVGKGKGKDIEVDILLSLEESLNGCKKELKIESVKRDLNCNDCSGSGKDVNGKKIPCKSCAGHGKIISSRKHVMNVITCDVCNGLGVLFISSCKTCHGSGKTKSIKFVSIFIPPGVEAGQKLRIQGKGNFIENGEPGDLYVTIYVDQREECSRIGDNLKIIHYTPIIDFLIGLKQNIKLPNGSNVNIDILPGMQPDHEVIVKGAGATNIKTKNKGDLIVVLKAILPSTLTPRARKLVEELKIEFNKTNH